MPVTNPNKKPYDFVRLSPEGRESKPVGDGGHGEWRDLGGRLRVTLAALTPLHVASGMTVPATALREFQDITWPPGMQEPLILEHYRSAGRRVIPATSLKGCVRSIVEAISPSCIGVATRGGKDVNKEPAREDTPFRKLLPPCKVPRERGRGGQVRLCPACHLFGALGFEGKVRFHDALQSSGGGFIALRPAPQQPNKKNEGKNQTGFEKYYRQAVNGDWYVKGRKFYRHFGQPQNQHIRYEPAEVCDAGSSFEFAVDFGNLTAAELGLLLCALGQGGGVATFKLGASKPFGYGAVRVAGCHGEVWDGRGRREQCLEWDEGAVTLDWAEVSAGATARAREVGLILTEQLEELKAILSEAKVAEKFSAADIARWREGKDDYVE